LQEQPTNRPAVLGSKALVLSGQGKGSASYQVRVQETNASKPLTMYCDINPLSKLFYFRKDKTEHSGNLFTGYVAIDIQVA
jgi:hypothetical protein